VSFVWILLRRESECNRQAGKAALPQFESGQLRLAPRLGVPMLQNLS